MGSGEILTISNNLLAELKNSYPIWDDLVAKTGKFHTSLKLTIQTATAFLDAIQKVADLASRTCGGSREIGACLTRLCLRQRRLETKLKTMSNHLITSLANPLSLKIDEWRRTLNQLEKDRARQTKKARAELKRAVSEASRWQKKAAKCGTSGADLGPGVGHGIVPSSNGTKASAIAAQSSQAARDVKVKTELLENAERSAVRSFMLEERSRFCFFLTCLLPFLEFESSMLSEISAIDELLHSLSKAAEKPNQLMEDAESVLYAAGRGDAAALLRRGDMRSSLYPHESENPSSLIAAATAALFASNDRTQGGSSDTDSGRLTMEASGTERKADDPSDNCSLSSSTQFQLHVGSGGNNVRCGSICDGTGSSIGGASSHSSGSGSNHGYGTSSISSGAFGASGPTDRPSYNSNNGTSSPRLVGLDPTGGLGSHHSSINSVNIMNSGPGGEIRTSSADDPHVHPDSSSYQAEADDTQFQTLCRPRHCRTVSVGGSTTGNLPAKGGTNGVLSADAHPGSASIRSDSTSEANLSLNLICFQSEHGTVTVDPEWLRQCDDDEEDEDDDDGDEDYEENPESARPNADEEGGDYVQVTEKAKVPVTADQRFGGRANAMGEKSALFDGLSANAEVIASGLTSGRHTISSAYEHGPSASRTVISNTAFNPPIAKSSSKDSGVDSSTVLYPNQAVPPPVYTNLNQLAHAAQRKFSIPQLSPSVGGMGSHLADVGEAPPKRDSDTHSLKRMMTCPPSDSPSRTQGEFTPADGTGSMGISGRPQKHQSVMELSNIGTTTRQSPLPVSQSIASQLSSANRRGTIATTDPTVRPNSNGIDPFSVEMDELDKLGAGLESFGFSSLPRYNSLPKMSSKRDPVGVSPLAMTSSLHEQAYDSDTSDTSTGLTLFSSDSRATLLSFCPNPNSSDNQKTSGDQKRTSSVDYLGSAPRESPSISSFVTELKHRASTCNESSRAAKYLQRNDRQLSTPTSPRYRPSIPPPVSPKPFHLREALAMHRINSFRQFPRRPPSVPVRCSSCQGSTNSLSMVEPPSTSQTSSYTAGSSCASSLTMASSTTSESQPSTNGALGGNKKPTNGRSLSSQFGDMSPQEPCQPRQEVDTDIHKSANFGRNCHSVYQNIRGPEMSGPGGSPARPVSTVCQLDGELPPPPPTAAQWTASYANRNSAASSLEAAHLMSELSSQLQQLAKRTNEDSIPNYSSPSVNKYNQSAEQTNDDFDLPPPPPPSMFGANSGSADQGAKGGNVDNSQDALLSALKRTIEMREARFSSARDQSTPPRPK